MSLVPMRRRAPRRQPLDQDRIVRAALALLDDVGVDELTMRRLAERLGVKAASLYRHVRNKDELLGLLADEIAGEIPMVPPSGNWRNQLTEIAWNVRRGLLAHRDGARVLADTAPVGPHRLRHIESLLHVLRSAGLQPRQAARVGYHCNNFVTEFAADEARFAASIPARGGARRRVFADARKYFKSLPPAEYPTVVALADHLTENDQDALFQFGLDVWLDGIEQMLKHAR